MTDAEFLRNVAGGTPVRDLMNPAAILVLCILDLLGHCVVIELPLPRDYSSGK